MTVLAVADGLGGAREGKEASATAVRCLSAALAAARQASPHRPVEIEVRGLEELALALEAGADRILLDNFSLDELRRAVQLGRGRARLEVSGGVGLEDLKRLADCGVEEVSVGALTKHCRSIDLSMKLVARL